EIDILKKLSHRHIIQFVGTFNHKKTMGLVVWPVATLRGFSEKSPGSIHRFRELDIKVESCALARPLARKWLCQQFGCLASAIYYIHQNGIRHKDLKPSNVLLTPSGVRLTDFGTSTDFSDRPSSESNNGERGTPIYFAPEVAAHQISGRPADIFMLGCVFFEM
ncbi:kinase-like protein, partial [Glonium stellatum]